MIYKLDNGGVIKLQKAWTKIPRILRKAIKGFGKTIDKTTTIPAQVKYYGPTMGKTTSIRTNPSLVDFDAIMRDPSKELLKKYGFDSKYQMFESGNQDAIKEYQDLLVQKMNEFKSNPNNSGKVLVVSQSPVVNPEDTGFQFDNEPSIPSKDVFVSRNVGRGGTTFDSEDWWSNLIQRNPNLKIDNRFVSDIEGSKELIHVPKIVIPDIRTYHLVDYSMPLSRPISETEIKGKPKIERNIKQHGTAQAPYYDYSLINRNYEPWTINEKGEFVFDSPEKSKKLATIHFSLNEPVWSHIQGHWEDAPTTILLPYRNIRSQTRPVDIAIMDTFFPNYNGLKVSSRGAKVLTGDKSTFDYYMGKGVDVEFSPELESLINKLKSIRKELDKFPDKERYATEPSLLPEPIKTLNNEELEILNKMDEISRAWTELHAKKIPSFEKLNELGKAEGLDMDKYPYSLGTPKKDGYGRILPESSELNYTWVSDPSNHSVMLTNPKYLLELINRGEYEVIPEYKKFIEWLINHKADYRKQGGILKAQKGDLIGYPIPKNIKYTIKWLNRNE